MPYNVIDLYITKLSIFLLFLKIYFSFIVGTQYNICFRGTTKVTDFLLEVKERLTI